MPIDKYDEQPTCCGECGRVMLYHTALGKYVCVATACRDSENLYKLSKINNMGELE